MHFMSLRNTGLEVYSHGKLSLAKNVEGYKAIFFLRKHSPQLVLHFCDLPTITKATIS